MHLKFNMLQFKFASFLIVCLYACSNIIFTILKIELLLEIRFGHILQKI